ncbi:MAG: tRNA adenosine(34) deaminase TadA [Peptoniphilaceae bacterium]|uniref:tRNA adenosine(34) deaminase TadA n=1 Tax=Parvimonas sp. TaxID=1944660 RepID=UPI0025DCE4CD|nr:tRNA adenosine(34) deaminase TadA [Parvimonas sp.]MCI5996814.1 tRNA adenosine(34) deaminase TadA [Parvimonas sp.]MDD7764801.1 tRNA adenosine(34) deaminase TadA [Peptoniphilaceae bacterium]MDY3050867.1 tRNA adenosine(34) deaminase TadA [Parvimonas sp.]
MNREEKFMKLAINEAKKAYLKNEVPVGCVIVKDDKVIARGHNQVMKKKSALFHAEMIALEKAGKKLGDFRLENCELYVTLEPCCMCAGAIVNSRIKKVIVGAMDVKRGFCGSVENLLDKKELNHKVECVTGILKDECLEILQNFFKILRNKK